MTWWKWPAKPGNDYLPWYEIGVNLMCWPFLTVLSMAFYVLILLTSGKHWADDFWSEWGAF
jgi:hypothetical protein